MTITSYDNRRAFSGNGSTTAFAFPPPFTTSRDLVVQRQEANGTLTPLVLATDYTVSGAGNPAGGTVTMAAAPAIGTTLIIYRDVPLTQPVTLLDGGPLPAGTVTGMLDRITMWGQRLKEQIGVLSGMASSAAAGLMSATDKAKLDGIAAGAQVNAVTSVAGRTGDVLLAKGDIGLGNVDNTADLSKPPSTATQAALDARLVAADNLADLADPAVARVNLGGGSTGIPVFQAGSPAAALAALGAGSTGASLLGAASAAAARTTLGTAIGSDVQAFSPRLADVAGTPWAQGDIAYFNGTKLERLAAGSSGQFLRTLGSGANPGWATIAGGGNMLSSNNLADVADVAAARANLGATNVGSGLFTVADAASARAMIGAGSGTVTSIDLAVPAGLSVNGPPISGSGTITLTWNGLIPVAQGSTGLASYAVGDLLYASGAMALSRLAAASPGNALISGGASTAPSWGKVGLATHVSGTLGTANGGTSIAAYAAGDILYGNAANMLSKLPAGADGQVLTLAGGLPSWGASAPISVPKRQTVLSGPSDTAGLPNFWPMTSASLTLTMQNVTASDLLITIAKGFGTAGALDMVLKVSTNLSLSFAPSAGRRYIFIDDTGAFAHSALPFIAQRGGAISTANEQRTYDINAGQMYIGNGTAASPVNEVALGECLVGASSISNVICYAYQGYYDSGWINNLPTGGSQVTKITNIGTGEVYGELIIKNISADLNYNVGDIYRNMSSFFNSTVGIPVGIVTTSNTVGFTLAAMGLSVINKTTAGSAAPTAAKWAWKLTATRQW